MSDYNDNGCNGGWLVAAWNYYATHGLVTGSDSDQQLGCKPNVFHIHRIAMVFLSALLTVKKVFL